MKSNYSKNYFAKQFQSDQDQNQNKNRPLKLNTSSNTIVNSPTMKTLESTGTKTDLNSNVESWMKSGSRTDDTQHLEMEKAKRYETPVKIDNSAHQNEDGYENPIFIHKKERLEDDHKEIQFNKVTQINLKQEMQNDIQTFMSQFTNSQDKDERHKICKLKFNSFY